MTSEPAPDLPSPGRFAAHQGAAILALAAALAVQSAWPVIAARAPAASWWPLDAAALAAAAAYFLATAWLHWGTAAWAAGDLRPRLWRLARGLAADLAVGILAVIVLIRGPESGMFQAGLWLLPPALFTVAAVSLVVSALALQRGLRQLQGESMPAMSHQPRTDLIRALVTVGLLVTIVAIERYQPSVKPWETGGPGAAAPRPATDR